MSTWFRSMKYHFCFRFCATWANQQYYKTLPYDMRWWFCGSVCIEQCWRRILDKNNIHSFHLCMISESCDEAWPMYHMWPISERFMPQCLSGFVHHDYWSCVIEFSDSSITGLGCCGHWGRVTHICVVKLTIIGSDNGLSPGRRQAVTWTNAAILLIGPLGTNFSEILIGIQTLSFNKMHLKMPSAKWCLFCLGLNVLSCVSPLPWEVMGPVCIRPKLMMITLNSAACCFQGPFSTSPSPANSAPGYSSTVESDSSEVLHIFLTFHLLMTARYCWNSC